VDEGLLHRFVTVFVLDVLSYDPDVDFVLGVIGVIDDLLPAREVRLGGFKMQVLERERVDSLMRKVEGHFINAGDVARGDDGPFFKVAEESDLALQLFRE